MKRLLNEQLLELARCEQSFNATAALDKHRTLVAKARVKRLLLSPKGLFAAFGAGVANGMIKDDGNTTLMSKHTVIKHAVSLWLAG